MTHEKALASAKIGNINTYLPTCLATWLLCCLAENPEEIQESNAPI